MIKVNLLLDIAEAAGKPKKKKFSLSSEFTNTFATQLGDAAGDETRMLISRVLVFVVPLILTFAYRGYVRTVSEEDLKRLKAEKVSINAKLDSLQSSVKEVEKFQEEKRKLTSQLEVIKSLSKERLKNVKSLDMLQTIIPSKAWLTTLKISEKKVELNGMAVDDNAVAEFMGGLSTSIYFSNVSLVSSEEFKQKDGTVKKFTIKTTLENL